MSVTNVARRYAQALADVVTHQDTTAQVDGELEAFVNIWSQNRQLRDVFASPVVSMNDKLKVLNAVIERTHPSATTTNLLRLLLRHYRLHQLDDIYRQFRREMNERRGIVPAEVTTAAPIGPDEREKFLRQLQHVTGKRVELDFKTDTSLIGGAVTRIGSVIYDGSIRTQLSAIRQKLAAGES